MPVQLRLPAGRYKPGTEGVGEWARTRDTRKIVPEGSRAVLQGERRLLE